jgi:CPA2 family monovalent cation:H+ antiporter-2
MRHPLDLLVVLFVVLIGKSAVAFAIVQMMGYPMSTALTISASLAQIGEFSFILAALGIALGIFPSEGRDLILAAAVLSLAINPLAFASVKPLQELIQRRRGFLSRFAPGQELRLARLELTLAANRAETAKKTVGADELIGRWPVLADLTLAQRAELLALVKPRYAVPGERLIRKGDAANELFFISSGQVEVALGRQKIVLKAGDLFGEMGLLNDAPRNADVTAIDYCHLLTIDKPDFRAFVDRHPELRARITSIAAERDAVNRREAAAV